jgi:hypothetical protein
MATDADTSMNESSNLTSFLTLELAGYGLEVADGVWPKISDWTISRDEFGFVVKTTVAAHAPLRSYLESFFPPARFDDSIDNSDGTLIYRDDKRFTTAMLNRSADETELIVLHWKDPEVRKKIAVRQEAAIYQVLDDELKAIESMFEDAATETNDAKLATKFEQAEQRLNESFSALDALSETNDKREDADAP